MDTNTKNKLSANTIILGFTGLIGSGCTYIAEGIRSQYRSYYTYTSLSKILQSKDILQKYGATGILTVEQKQELGNKVREKNGNSYLVDELLEKLRNNSSIGIIVDSIKNDGEVQALRQFPFFYLFSIHSDEKIRCKRTIACGKFKNEDEFYEANLKDCAEDTSNGQQVNKCNDLSDIIIDNSEYIPQHAEQDKKRLIDDIYNRYISLIERKVKGLFTPENLPNINETLMTMAYAESQRSSCLKRKVGAIIVSLDTAQVTQNNKTKSIKESVHIHSSGHNEVPFGVVPCIFNPDYEKCYRDYLQEKQAEKFKHCPNCGKKIKLPKTKCKTKDCDFETSNYRKVCPKCKNELEVIYYCSCDTNNKVFDKYLIGGGKLLDMCRALHAEENALLNLTKIGSNISLNLVLYTTTYPCNLCANKIAAARIRKVIYAYPYSMNQAEKILEAGGVKTEKFEGIKNSAFFKLYK